MSSIADTGGLVASGDGTAVLKLKETFCEGLLNPLKLEFIGGGLDADGVAGTGGVPLLNSAQRGHFRFVSATQRQNSIAWKRRSHTHVPHLSAVTAASL